MYGGVWQNASDPSLIVMVIGQWMDNPVLVGILVLSQDPVTPYTLNGMVGEIATEYATKFDTDWVCLVPPEETS